jgi:hypothetical protein
MDTGSPGFCSLYSESNTDTAASMDKGCEKLSQAVGRESCTLRSGKQETGHDHARGANPGIALGWEFSH